MYKAKQKPGAGNNEKEISNYEIQILLNFKDVGFRLILLNLPSI